MAEHNPSQTSRIAELEHALQCCVDYLGRLPVAPVTRKLQQRCRQVLDQDRSPIIFEGAKYAPSGVMIARVTLQGCTATVQTAFPNSADPVTWHAIACVLDAGLTVHLAPAAGDRILCAA